MLLPACPFFLLDPENRFSFISFFSFLFRTSSAPPSSLPPSLVSVLEMHLEESETRLTGQRQDVNVLCCHQVDKLSRQSPLIPTNINNMDVRLPVVHYWVCKISAGDVNHEYPETESRALTNNGHMMQRWRVVFEVTLKNADVHLWHAGCFRSRVLVTGGRNPKVSERRNQGRVNGNEKADGCFCLLLFKRKKKKHNKVVIAQGSDVMSCLVVL